MPRYRSSRSRSWASRSATPPSKAGFRATGKNPWAAVRDSVAVPIESSSMLTFPPFVHADAGPSPDLHLIGEATSGLERFGKLETNGFAHPGDRLGSGRSAVSAGGLVGEERPEREAEALAVAGPRRELVRTGRRRDEQVGPVRPRHHRAPEAGPRVVAEAR